MEDGLRLNKQQNQSIKNGKGLNPCFCGRWSATMANKADAGSLPMSLNPCFCGRWSATHRGNDREVPCLCVLILVFVEDGLRLGGKITLAKGLDVLILVFVEDGLRHVLSKYL